MLKTPSSEQGFSQENISSARAIRLGRTNSCETRQPRLKEARRTQRPDAVAKAPEVISSEAHLRFRELCRENAFDPDNPWLGDYVDYEWRHARPLLADIFDGQERPRVLEFGCNIGATAIVLAHQGADVTAIDVSPDLVSIATSNIERYGMQDKIELQCLANSAKLPVADNFFDHIVCNSVLEYVPAEALDDVRRELVRVLKPGGSIHILGTSNRMWPWEIHSRTWFTNYLPRFVDRWIGRQDRGLFPWELTSGFPGLVNDDLRDDADNYLAAKEAAGCRGLKLQILKWLARIGRPFGITPGLVTSSIVVRMRKPG